MKKIFLKFLSMTAGAFLFIATQNITCMEYEELSHTEKEAVHYADKMQGDWNPPTAKELFGILFNNHTTLHSKTIELLKNRIDGISSSEKKF